MRVNNFDSSGENHDDDKRNPGWFLDVYELLAIPAMFRIAYPQSPGISP